MDPHSRFIEVRTEPAAIKDVVAQDERDGLTAYELATNDECLCQSLWSRLHRICERDAPASPVAEQLLEAGGVPWRGDDENFANARQHQR